MTNQQTNLAEQTNDNRTYVLAACRLMLRPIVRLLLKSGIVQHDLMNLTREVYVDIARTEFGIRRRPTSVSRTALLTGLARKEVRRIMDSLDSDDIFAPAKQDRITRVLSAWCQEKDYQTRDGQPRAIPADGPAPSFADLKTRFGGDVPAGAVLRELLNSGTVVRQPNGLLRPVQKYFMPNPTDPEHLRRAGSVVEDMGTTVMRNLYRSPGDPGWFERRAVNTCMPISRLREFRSYIADRGQQFLEDIDVWMTQNEEPETEEETIRLGLGMYIIIDNEVDL